jgi:hypothetical protein
MKTTHTHHIIPKHMGGTDDKKNLIELTPKQHALAHKKLYEKHGKWEDKIAYQMLSGQITRYAAQQQVRRLANLGNKNALGMKHTKEGLKKIGEYNMVAKLGNTYRLGKTHTNKTKNQISNSLKGNSNKLGKTGYKLSEETKKKMSASRMGDNNPAKRKDVREKLRLAALRRYGHKV